jgi:hypothetical protein
MRFRPRFTLRTLFIAIALISVLMAWVAYERHWIQQRHEFLRKHCASWTSNSNNDPIVQPPWHLRLFGERGLLGIKCQDSLAPEARAEARALFPEHTILYGPLPFRP